MSPLILASGSAIRAQLLRNSGVPFEVFKPRIDEDAARLAMEAEALEPRDIADHLAEMKAARIAAKFPQSLVLGCDQVLAFDGRILSKPATPAEAEEQIIRMSGQTHLLHSAAVLFEHRMPAWRHLGTVRLTMRSLSQDYIRSYVARNWEEIRHCVGGYQIEAEGVRLFSRIEGDYFTILGLPLLPLLDNLVARGMIET